MYLEELEEACHGAMSKWLACLLRAQVGGVLARVKCWRAGVDRDRSRARTQDLLPSQEHCHKTKV